MADMAVAGMSRAVGAVEAVGPELVIALIGALGTDLQAVGRALARRLAALHYRADLIELDDLVTELDPFSRIAQHPEAAHLAARMAAADDLRTRLGRHDALAMLAVNAIAERREALTGHWHVPVRQHAFILSSLKRPEEAALLRHLYGAHCVIVGAYAPRPVRLRQLIARLASASSCPSASASSPSPSSAASAAAAAAVSSSASTSAPASSAGAGAGSRDRHARLSSRLMKRDADGGAPFGQRVSDTFALADIFVRADDAEKLDHDLRRAVELLFGFPFHTPTRDEHAMFLASGASRRSSALTRQVGAAITTARGEIVATGCNDVPRAGGGLYWPEDANDARDFRRGYDPSARARRAMTVDILRRLDKAGWLDAARASRPRAECIDEALGRKGVFRGAQFGAVVEFGRVIHAEMTALTDAAARGVPLAGTTLYTTTFPCHGCARHIVSAGVRRVVFIEPYPKSRALELHDDAIVLEPVDDASGRVALEPFVGVAPRAFEGLFAMVARETDDGRAVTWDASCARPRFTPALGYLAKEEVEVGRLREQMQRIGVFFVRRRTRGFE